MKYFRMVLSCILVSFTANATSQVINNGDFEDNFLNSCFFTFSNLQYSNRMPNSWGFGPGNNLDIQTIKNNSSCAYANPQSGQTFVSLGKSTTVGVDAFSLEISIPLSKGDLYEVSYYDYASDTFNLSNIPLHVGLSLDSLSFGTFIHESTPEINSWTKQTFRFVAPNDAKYLTVSMIVFGETPGWTFVDNFQISNVTGIDEYKNLEAKVYPNPSQEKITIESDFLISQLTIYDLLGNEVLFMNTPKSYTTQLNVSNIIPGYYLLKVQGVDGISKKIKLCITSNN